MIDGRFGSPMNGLWEWLARGLVRIGLSPNAVTWTGGALVVAACLAYPIHGNGWVFGVWLAVAFAFDGLDGAVARLTHRSTHGGGYLDAVIDRYQEAAVLASLAYTHNLWAEAFLAVTGAMLISYNKARVAVEMPVDNGNWPDLMERFERVVFMVMMVFAAQAGHMAGWRHEVVLQPALLFFAVLVHFSALQRFARARRRLSDHDRLADRSNNQ